MKLKQYIRKNIYQWHRVSGLIIALPVLMWTLSGFLHPVMNVFKPNVKSSLVAPVKIDTSKIKFGLAAALQQNGIDSIANFRIVKLDSFFYYQLQLAHQKKLVYINCNNGTVLQNGDVLYAEQLAKHFLTGNTAGANNLGCHNNTTNGFKEVVTINNEATPAVTEIKLLTSFDEEYKGSQKLLPVYRVAFQRNDDIRLYIETKADRLAYAVDSRKAWYSRFFAMVHTWSFLNGLSKAKSILLGAVSLLCFASSLFGFYVYNISNKKKKATNKNKGFAKPFHRIAGNVFLVTTLLYAFSGAWHAFNKIPAQNKAAVQQYMASFTEDELNLSLSDVCKCLQPGEVLSNVSVVEMNGANYWQVAFVNGNKQKGNKYIDMQTMQPVQDGEQLYACYLACELSGQKVHCVKSVKSIAAFNHAYSMMNKRLPVVQVEFSTDQSCYVETATGTLAAITNNTGKAERFSFSNLHMHHYAEMWGGKGLRNTILIASTLGLLLVALTGITMFVNKRFLK